MALIKLLRPPEYLIPDERRDVPLRFDESVLKWQRTIKRLFRRRGQRRGWQPRIGPGTPE